ncbi:AAA family ATPase [Desulfosporosinus sp. BICA1-9]|uniref:AAA family ATPase n=1 Tax=Desulfosporosinus sp. BICA1-9 TaxID=1531958 RepID=UPI00054BCFC8|nr:AAA family ATPase [Desulfosporosinus sp. BICA1-9]KJS46779.1 MAG: anticodon nuclease [Peptococcaceae bacterium BRH_c23]KJS85197.1 MAG: anticodon nuclease [Desulfosporosinus sp. BICA1-9]HBW38314.1 anticodon nuclease [Desulfosporosinus sp.]
MSYNIPSKIEKVTFKTMILKKLNNDKFSHHKKLFSDNYKCPRNSEEYTLRENLSDALLAKLDFVLKRIGYNQFDAIKDIAKYFRILLDEKKYIVLFAYNGTGKTRLSVEFKSLGQQLIDDTGEKTADTLYYNAFTEDLFNWDNDLDNDTERVLKLNSNSRFFSGLEDLEMESRIRPFLHRYADFDFDIKYEESGIIFFRDVLISGTTQRIDNIKISRGEENIFIWCFFLAIVQLVVDKAESYNWVKYIYVDDPISSLDDNNVIAVASHLAQLMSGNDIKVIVSSHHTLFFNVLCNEINKAEQLFLQKNAKSGTYILKDTTKTPFFHHVALLKELKKASDSDELYTYHFNILRNILEKTASFHGFAHFSSCIRKGVDEDEPVYTRLVNLLSHGNYSLFDPKEMVEENKEHFKNILNNFLDDYNFNKKLFEDGQVQEEQE